MDEYDLHGKILPGMAKGIENAYLVLICYTDKYAKSDYCYQGNDEQRKTIFLF